MGVSQRLHMHITSLINMAFNNNHETPNMLKSSIRACKQKQGVRNSYKNH